MLADAVFAEGYRLLRNRATLFWSVLFIPIASMALSVIGNLIMRAMAAAVAAGDQAPPPQIRLALQATGIDLGQGLLKVTGDLAGPATLVFVLIGAATLFAGDYRWETWRLITPRNGRVSLLLGKVGVLKMLALAAMLALMIAGVGQLLIKAAILSTPLTFTFSGGDFGRLAGLFVLSYWRIVQFAMLALLAAVMSRSLMAALFVPLVVGVAQAASPLALSQFGMAQDHWFAVLINPGMATDIMKALIAGGTAATLIPAPALTSAVISLLFWMLAPLIAAIVWFNRQDLSKE